ncbi:MAG: hypothetical protein GQ554_09605 [Deltaproteobacteria bacterium]|nr:hypothetical protein [Deltaproteobacteria bacterium]
MKPPEGMYQTATKVKVLSPETYNIEEADSVRKLEGRMSYTAMARYSLLFRGLRPWYGTERKLSEPGRPVLFLQRQMPGNNLERREFRDDSAGVGLIHSRGVAGVMPCEERVHSKGLALICIGKGKHVSTPELEGTCEQN